MINKKMKITDSRFYYRTSAGFLQVHVVDGKICASAFTDEPKEITNNVSTKNIELQGTQFQCAVWHAAMHIPAGATMTYQELATKIGKPKSFRAVANALAQNKIAYFVPCHRVIRKNGELGGYKWGIERKQKLLEAEGAFNLLVKP